MYFRNFLSSTGSGFQTLSGSPIPKYWSRNGPPPPLHCRHNVAPVSILCKATQISLFWGPSRLNELLKMHFEFPFKLTGKSTVAFFTGHSWCALKFWYNAGGPEQGFQRCFADGLTRSLVLSVAQAKLHIDLPKILLQDRFQLTN